MHNKEKLEMYDEYNTLGRMTEDQLRDVYDNLSSQLDEIVEQMCVIREELETRGLTT